MWLITTSIAVLAAGSGIVAYLRYFRPPRPRLQTHIWLQDTPFYEMKEQDDAISVRRSGTNFDSAGSRDLLYPLLSIDVTNPTDNRISIYSIQLSFSELSELETGATIADVIVVKFRSEVPPADREALARQHSLDLIASRPDDVSIYHATSGKADRVVTRIETESEVVEFAFLEAQGRSHQEFAVTQTVDIKVDPERKQYEHRIGHTVDAHDSLTIPVIVGASQSLTGRATLGVAYEDGNVHNVGELGITIEVPEFLRAAERDNSQATRT
jgi:hypothetical protein